MIKNSKQLALTNKRIEEFSSTIAQLQSEPAKLSPLLAKAQIDALTYQLETLEQQKAEYERLLAGEFAVFDVNNIADLPKSLIMARIALGLTQKNLAERLGMKEQQIQRYENTEYGSASFTTLVSIVEALDLKITEDVFLPRSSRQKNILLEKLRNAGLDKHFIEKRISPRDSAPFDDNAWIEKTTARLYAIFGWTKDLLLGDSPLVIGRDASMVARFKMPVGANELYASAYTQYAYSLAQIIASNCNLKKKDIATDPNLVRSEITKMYGDINFESVLKYTTDLGIPVMSLNDSGAFHGATWRIKNRNVIVLKQKSKHASKWAFDLLHELYHASQSPELEEFAVVELSETSDERRNDKEEIQANEFAAKVLLGSDVGTYIEACFKKAQGKVAWLKNSVIQVANDNNLDCGILAYQVANRLDAMSKAKGSKENWWGAAHNLQKSNCEPSLLCYEILMSHISLGALDDINRELIEQAFAY